MHQRLYRTDLLPRKLHICGCDQKRYISTHSNHMKLNYGSQSSLHGHIGFIKPFQPTFLWLEVSKLSSHFD